MAISLITTHMPDGLKHDAAGVNGVVKASGTVEVIGGVVLVILLAARRGERRQLWSEISKHGQDCNHTHLGAEVVSL